MSSLPTLPSKLRFLDLFIPTFAKPLPLRYKIPMAIFNIATVLIALYFLRE